MTVDPAQAGLVAAGALLYGVRARTLRRRGTPLPPARLAWATLALAALLAAIVSPLYALGEHDFFWAHMLVHVLVGDVAPLLAVLALSVVLLGPARRALRSVHPVALLLLWALNLYLWHLPALYDAALAHEPVHLLQHVLFFLTGLALWSVVIEPLPLRAPLAAGWKLLYLVAVQLLMMGLAMVFVWSSTAFYGRYASAAPTWGLSALDDQRLGGIVMLAEGNLVLIGAFAWVFLRALAADREADAAAVSEEVVVELEPSRRQRQDDERGRRDREERQEDAVRRQVEALTDVRGRGL